MTQINDVVFRISHKNSRLTYSCGISKFDSTISIKAPTCCTISLYFSSNSKPMTMRSTTDNQDRFFLWAMVFLPIFSLCAYVFDAYFYYVHARHTANGTALYEGLLSTILLVFMYLQFCVPIESKPLLCFYHVLSGGARGGLSPPGKKFLAPPLVVSVKIQWHSLLGNHFCTVLNVAFHKNITMREREIVLKYESRMR